MDETLNALYEESGEGYIVVGIDHGDDQRMNEYAPWSNPEYGGGQGNNYIQFIIETLKPFVDEHYRTLQTRENTALIGSSLGGLISLYTGMTQTSVFSKIGALSPAFWFNREIFNLTDSINIKMPMRFYFSCGSLEPITVFENMYQVDSVIRKNELVRTKIEIHDGYNHEEKYWKAIFKESVQWLFETDLAVR